MLEHTVTADRGDNGQRLDLVLRRHLAAASSASRVVLQAWIRDGKVTVNGTPVSRPSARISAGDVIQVTLPNASARRVMLPEPGALAILYEDADLLVINKPAGLIVHPSFKHDAGTLMNALLWHARSWPTGSRPSLVGRLDKQTSGIVLVAKRPAAHAVLQRATAPGRAEKDYLAVVYGRVNRSRGEIDLKLARDARDRRRVVASPTTGAASVTQFERLVRLAAPRPPLSLVRCRLITGRMHQIRVHLAARGWPIVGDPVYGSPPWSLIKDRDVEATLRAFPRQALHAHRISFKHLTGDRLTVEAPLPPDMRALIDALELGEIRN